jgi:hypothetical protein
MNNKQFISKLNKALSGLDKSSKNDIIQEIKSHAAESGAPLIEQFVSVDELAKQYLDGEKIAKPITTKIWGMSKSFFKIVGIVVITLIAIIALFSYYFTKDKFNYADENAVELSTKNSWQSQEWTTDLELISDQASLVLYWHDTNTVRWDCKGDSPEKVSDSSLLFRRSHCLVYLPKVTTVLNAEQSQIVLVKPQVSLSIDARQASIRVAEKGEKYKYELDTNRTKFTDLNSADDAQYTIKFKTKETSISAY